MTLLNPKRQNILALDDDENRLNLLRKHLIGNSLTTVKTVDEAKDWLSKRIFDLILLDHDLLDHHYTQGWDGLYDEADTTTGFEIARLLGEDPALQPEALVIVHTLSPFGSHRMMKALSKRTKVLRIEFYQLPFFR